jgi:ribosome biogenesis protein SSF1/2
MRRVMAPYTADNLKEKRKNTLKDFMHIGAPLGVTHFIFFTSTEASTNMKVARIPRGPTLSFKVIGFSLMRHLHLIHKRPVDTSVSFVIIYCLHLSVHTLKCQFFFFSK